MIKKTKAADSKKTKAVDSKTTKAVDSKNSKHKESASKVAEEQDFPQELVDSLIEKGKRTGALSYEELMEFCERNSIGETEINEIIKTLDREHIELVMQEELEAEPAAELLDYEQLEDKKQLHIKSHMRHLWIMLAKKKN